VEILNRRNFIRTVAVAGGATVALNSLMARSNLFSMSGVDALASTDANSYGPLFDTLTNNTGEKLLALPEGFQYNVIGRLTNPDGTPNIMSDGRPTPGVHDGMAAFGVDGMIRLVRNHEQSGGSPTSVAIGANPYDLRATGGTTTLIVNPVTRLVISDFVSLSGTVRNCAGGVTPWNSWISSEETTLFPIPGSNSYMRNHGYNFDVSALSNGEVAPIPLKAMGRFSHEAIAVDPANNYIYETEDANPSGFYRFIPSQPGGSGQAANLAAGGILQMLAIKGKPKFDTRNSPSSRTQVAIGEELPAYWVEIKNPDPALENGARSVVNQGISRGGAIFARLEGCWYGDGSIYFASTSGGRIGKGQIWKYTPTSLTEGYLTLIFESPNELVLDSPDNICFSPRGGLVICEDGSGEEFVHGLTQSGQIFKFAKNIVPGNEGSEFAGACFSPDGETLFVNLQGPGLTFAIWPKAGYAWTDGAL
jgi:uncharacterized protein